MIGAVFISHERSETTYWTMASYLRKHCPELKNLKAFGTDGDVSLVNGIQAVFPEAQHLLCDLHMRDNIASELSKANVLQTVRDEVLTDIFGKRKGNDKIGLLKILIFVVCNLKLFLFQPDLLTVVIEPLSRTWRI